MKGGLMECMEEEEGFAGSGGECLGCIGARGGGQDFSLVVEWMAFRALQGAFGRP